MQMMKFSVYAKNASANVGKREITISFTMPLNDENMKEAEALAFYIGKGAMLLIVNPNQIQMELVSAFDPTSKPEEIKGE